jgi:hypothetical protein
MQAHVLTTTLFAALLLAPFAPPAAAQCCAGHNHGVVPAPSVVVPETAVQTTVVTFRDPVLVGDRILLGRYVIEHDNDRMARGEPCTHIYAASDTRLPVVAFHCTHLTRPAATTATVFLRRTGTYPLQELLDFQFAGESSSHGVPMLR